MWSVIINGFPDPQPCYWLGLGFYSYSLELRTMLITSLILYLK